MKYLRYCETIADYQNKREVKYWEPWVSLTNENDDVNYNRLKVEAPLTFQITGSGNIIWSTDDSSSTKTIQYSINNSDWISITSSTTGVTIPVATGDVVIFKGSNTSYEGHSSFKGSTCSFNVGGNIMSLVGGSNFINLTTLTGTNNFQNLFKNCFYLNQAHDLILQATTLGNYCYSSMFEGCGSLITVPTLPATTMTIRCYENMFADCSLLSQAPDLPATTLAEGCYYAMFSGTNIYKTPNLPATTLTDNCYAYMFAGCNNLQETSALPATTLTSGCYQAMFSNCTKLTTAPDLNAATLTTNCYNRMFYRCSKLNYIKCLAVDSSATDCTTNWTYNVASIGTFIMDPFVDDTWEYNSPDGIPVNWNTQFEGVNMNQPIRLFILSDGTINFSKKASGAVWKQLNAFLNGGSIQYLKAADTTGGSITVQKGDILQLSGNDNFYARNRSNYTYLGKSTARFNIGGNIMSFIENSAEPNNTYTAYQTANEVTADFALCGMFSESKVVHADGLYLPATKLTESCYRQMFMDCTSLVSAPFTIGGSFMASNACGSMFQNCTNLKRGPKLPALYLSSGCYWSMFQSCTSLEKAPELPAFHVETNCYNSMFSGCSSLNYMKCLAINNTNTTGWNTNWLNSVASTGSFIKHNDATFWTTGASGIPTEWTVESVQIDDFTKLINSYLSKVSSAEAIRTKNNNGTAITTGLWAYVTGIILKAFVEVYKHYPERNELLNFATTFYNKYLLFDGTIKEGYSSTELDDKEPCVAMMNIYELPETDLYKTVSRYKTMLDSIYNELATYNRNNDGVYYHKDSYANQEWLDGSYMVQPFRAEYAARYLTGIEQSAVFDDVCNQILTMCENTYDSATGLYRHAYDESGTATWIDSSSANGKQSYFCWGRALGWLMCAIVDVLDWLPEEHSRRYELIDVLNGICTSLQNYADATTGVWRLLPTEGTTDSRNILESTSSSMFAYAYLKGVRMGYLPASMKTYAKSVFEAVKNTFITEDNGVLTLNNCASGGNPGGSSTTRAEVLENYYGKTINTDDSHGIAPFIWASLEYEQLND